MGALEIQNKKLRCMQCLDIRRLLIIPGYPDPKIEIMCHCNKSVESLFDYYSEIKKTPNIKLVCTKCGKEEIKHPRFCYECQAVYCSKCCNSHQPRITDNEETNKKSNLEGHKTIHVEKLDFYCFNHQTENFIAYCQQCLMNLCSQCIKEGAHKFHQVEFYDVLQMDKKTKETFKKGIKKAEKKIENNNNLIKKFLKKNKKVEGIKEIEDEFNIESKENDYILEIIKKCYDIYDRSKIKNYSIIYNLIKNSKFNLKTLKLDKKENTEEKIAHISKYLKKDFFILYKRSKTNQEEFEVDNENEQEEEEDEDEDYTTTTTTFRSSSFHKTQTKMGNEILNKDEEQQNENITNESDANEIHTSVTQNYIPNQEEAQNKLESNQTNNIHVINNTQEPPPKQEIKKIKIPPAFNKQDKRPSAAIIPPPKKLKMPLMFEKREEEKKPAKPLPLKANLKIPSIFDKKEEDNKPKERAAIINTGATGNLGNKKDFLAQMMANKGKTGKPKGATEGPSQSSQPTEEKIEIIHESNETGSTEQVLNKVAVTNTKKKKPRKAKFVLEGEENQENPKPMTTPPSTSEPLPSSEPSTVTEPSSTTVSEPVQESFENKNKQEEQVQQVQQEIIAEVKEEHQEQQSAENEINE